MNFLSFDALNLLWRNDLIVLFSPYTLTMVVNYLHSNNFLGCMEFLSRPPILTLMRIIVSLNFVTVMLSKPICAFHHASSLPIFGHLSLPRTQPFLQVLLRSLFAASSNISKLRIFGCICYPWLLPYASHKLAHCSSPYVFLGYSLIQSAYLCYESSSRICSHAQSTIPAQPTPPEPPNQSPEPMAETPPTSSNRGPSSQPTLTLSKNNILKPTLALASLWSLTLLIWAHYTCYCS